MYLKEKINNQVILYLLVGLFTTLLNISLFYLLSLIIDYKRANIITLVIVKITCYFCYKKIVFKSHCKDNIELFKEIFFYTLSRFFTFLIEYYSLIILVSNLQLSKLFCKFFITVLVVILNYVLSRKVFSKKMSIKGSLFCIILIILTILRFLMSYKLPTYFVDNLRYDDGLMINMFTSLMNGNYLGKYNSIILTKGFIFPLFLLLFNTIKLSYSSGLTILYIISCMFFTYSLKPNIKNKIYLLIIYAFLLFNPISYSSELFQRLYRNSISIIELLFFLSFLIRIINEKKVNGFNYICIGLCISFMYLTREDSMWGLVVLVLLFIYKVIKDRKIYNILVNFIPIFLLIISLNMVRFINYKYYNIYTYNELTDSGFKNFYVKLKEIKDENKINRVSITKNCLYNFSEISKKFNITKDDIDLFYERYNIHDEIEDNDIIWYLRLFLYGKQKIRTGSDANKYFEDLSREINELFKEKKLEKEFVIRSVNLATPTFNDIKKIPKNYIKTISYVSSYKDIKTFDISGIKNNSKFLWEDYELHAYRLQSFRYETDSIVKENLKLYEVFRLVYKYLTIVLSIVSIIIYVYSIRKRDKICLICSFLLVMFVLITFGIAYNHTTSFNSIRYLYLGNTYILQELFILLNVSRLLDFKKVSF